jgi:hypothetical protein
VSSSYFSRSTTDTVAGTLDAEDAGVRDLVLGGSLFGLLLIAATIPNWSGGQADAVAAASGTPRPSPSSPVQSGAGFALCTADTAWQRPSEAEQRAHLDGDRRFDGWDAPGHPATRDFHASAVLYDGKSASGASWIIHLTGLWNVWSDAATRPTMCRTEQPQVFLFGFEAISYDAQDERTATLRVRPASGYRMVILTGRIRPQIRVVSDRTLDTLEVPSEWVTPPTRGH